jgi:hypothetical protein
MLGKTPSSENVAAARNLFDLADSQTSAQKRAKKVAVPAKKKK